MGSVIAVAIREIACFKSICTILFNNMNIMYGVINGEMSAPVMVVIIIMAVLPLER
jgi:hypothetical protein